MPYKKCRLYEARGCSIHKKSKKKDSFIHSFKACLWSTYLYNDTLVMFLHFFPSIFSILLKLFDFSMAEFTTLPELEKHACHFWKACWPYITPGSSSVFNLGQKAQHDDIEILKYQHLTLPTQDFFSKFETCTIVLCTIGRLHFFQNRGVLQDG